MVASLIGMELIRKKNCDVTFRKAAVLEIIFYVVFELNIVQEHGIDSADLISFLLELSFHVTGKVYVLYIMQIVSRVVIFSY